MGVLLQLFADSGGDSGGACAQCFSGAGADLCGVVGVCELVDDGADLSFGSVPARCSGDGDGAERVGGGIGEFGVYAAGGVAG